MSDATNSKFHLLRKGDWIRPIEPYLFIIPTLCMIILFKYIPMMGLQLAFKDFSPVKGIWGSPWVGMKHFTRFISSINFWPVFINTIRVSFFSLLFGWPMPIILALSLNEVKNQKFKGFVQTVSYAPHFISVVVIVGMVFLFTSPSMGVINTIIKAMGGDVIHFMIEPGWFLPIYIISGIWQGVGWGSIIYLASLSGINPEIYESATIDGASRIKRIFYINIPLIAPTIVILLILRAGDLLDVGFEKVFLMQTSLNKSASEVLTTYTYRLGLLGGQFSFATAVGLFKSIINLIMIIAVNELAKRVGETSLW